MFNSTATTVLPLSAKTDFWAHSLYRKCEKWFNTPEILHQPQVEEEE
jgi:hypothetical protein